MIRAVAFALMCSVSALAVAQEPAATATPASTEAPAIAKTVCAACHGPDGNSTIPANPSLAGQHAAYLVKQLKNFQASPDGKPALRQNAVMNGMAAPLSADEMKAKAQSLDRKLRTLIAGQPGWNISDLAQFSETERQMRALNDENAKTSSESKERRAAREEAASASAAFNRRLYEHGLVMMSYGWQSGYYTHRGTGLGVAGIPAQNLVTISITPNLEPNRGQFELFVHIALHLVQPYKAPLPTLAARDV